MIGIDGSAGEGGGQMVRSAVALSAVTRKPVTIYNIRGNRRRTGLQRQHVAAVDALCDVCRADTVGNYVGSDRLAFAPGPISGGEHEIKIEGPGSGVLALQTILPALLMETKKTTVRVNGGTHAAWSPPLEFLRDVYAPLVSKMGPQIEVIPIRDGHYPLGGGLFYVNVTPSPDLVGIELCKRGKITREVMGNKTCSMIGLHSDISHAMVTAYDIGDTSTFEDARWLAHSYEKSGASVDSKMADQLLLPFGVAAMTHGQTSSFTTNVLSDHSKTHITILQTYLDVKIEVSDTIPMRVTVSPK